MSNQPTTESYSPVIYWQGLESIAPEVATVKQRYDSYTPYAVRRWLTAFLTHHEQCVLMDYLGERGSFVEIVNGSLHVRTPMPPKVQVDLRDTTCIAGIARKIQAQRGQPYIHPDARGLI